MTGLGPAGVEQSAELVAAPRFARRLLRKPLALVCLALLFALVVVAVVSPIVRPGIATQLAGQLDHTLEGPSRDHLLGTDQLGRDVLDRLLVGSGVTLFGVLEALIVVVVLGVPLGLAAGYFGGRIDRLITWIGDLIFSLPAIVIVLVVLSVYPASMTAGMVTLGVLLFPGLMRVVRAVALPIREELYVAAARVSGLGDTYIVFRHVLPRVIGPVIVQLSLLASVALLVQTGLAYLGLIVAAPAPSWGGMVADGSTVIDQQSWLIWPPGLAITLTVLILGLFGDSLRDVATASWSFRAIPRRSAHHGGAAVPPQSFSAAQADDGTELLSVSGLSVEFNGAGRDPVQVLDRVSLAVSPGEIVGIVGESGSGKTVTAKALLGVLPAGGQIVAGQVIFAKTDLVTASEKALRRMRGRCLAMISQEPMVSLDPAFRIGHQLVEVIRTHAKVTRATATQRALELLRQVRVPNPAAMMLRYPYELSGGLAQRVAIARALAGDPEMLIADEPTTALDVTVQAEILDLLRELSDHRGMAILLVTHDWGVVADMCDRVVVMYAGEIVEEAAAENLFTAPLHPYTKALLESNPQRHVDTGVLPTIPGQVPRPGTWPTGCRFAARCSYMTAECAAGSIPLRTPEPDRRSRCLHIDELAPELEPVP